MLSYMLNGYMLKTSQLFQFMLLLRYCIVRA